MSREILRRPKVGPGLFLSAFHYDAGHSRDDPSDFDDNS